MRLEVEVPYGVETRPAGTRRDFRTGYVTATAAVDILEMRPDDCPPVARCAIDGRHVLFRSVDGMVAKRARRPARFADDAAWLRWSAASPTHVRGDGGALRIGRTGVIAVAGRDDDPRISVRHRDENVRSRAIAMTTSAAAHLVLLEGEVWERGPGPVVRLDPDGFVAATAMPVGGDARAYHQFRLDQVHLIGPYVREAFPGRDSPALPEFEILDAGLLGDFDPQACAMGHAARMADSRLQEEGLGDTLRRLGTSSTLDGPRLREAVTRIVWPEGSPLAARVAQARLAYDLAARDREAKLDEASTLTF